MIYVIFAISVLALLFAISLARRVLRADTGTPKMMEIAGAIKEGAEAFLRRQYRTIIMLSLVLAAVILLFYKFSDSPSYCSHRTNTHFTC